MILATPSGFRSRVVHQGDPLATVALRRLIRRYRRGAVSRGQRTFFGGVYGSSGPQRFDCPCVLEIVCPPGSRKSHGLWEWKADAVLPGRPPTNCPRPRVSRRHRTASN